MTTIETWTATGWSLITIDPVHLARNTIMDRSTGKIIGSRFWRHVGSERKGPIKTVYERKRKPTARVATSRKHRLTDKAIKFRAGKRINVLAKLPKIDSRPTYIAGPFTSCEIPLAERIAASHNARVVQWKGKGYVV